MVFCAIVSTGFQLFLVLTFSLLLAIIGFSHPRKRGYLLSTAIILFIVFGLLSGYVSSRLYKLFGGRSWIRNLLITNILYPGIVFGLFLLVNGFLKYEKSSAAISPSSVLILVFLWVFCSSPMIFIGGFYGHIQKTISLPVSINKLPSTVPPQPWYLKSFVLLFISGAIPFCGILVELIYIMKSVWRSYFYYLFGFLFIVLIIQVVISSQISIMLTYIQLCRKNFKWWWKSFVISGSSAIYVFGFAIYYYIDVLHLKSLSGTILYYGYMSIICITLFAISGSVGVLSTFLFLRKIYSMIKIS